MIIPSPRDTAQANTHAPHSERIARTQVAAETQAALDLETSRIAHENQVRLANDIRRRTLEQRKAALAMVQLADQQGTLDLGQTQLEILIEALEVRALRLLPSHSSPPRGSYSAP